MVVCSIVDGGITRAGKLKAGTAYACCRRSVRDVLPVVELRSKDPEKW